MSLFKLLLPGKSPLHSDSTQGPGVETMGKCSLLDSSLTHTQPHAQLAVQAHLIMDDGVRSELGPSVSISNQENLSHPWTQASLFEVVVYLSIPKKCDSFQDLSPRTW